MAITYRAGASGTGSTSVVVNVPSGVVNGDVMYLSVYSDGSITDPAGWVLLVSVVTPNVNTLNVYRRVASSEPVSYTISCGAGGVNSDAIIDAFIGVDNVTPEDATTPAGTSGSTNPANWPSITTVTDHAWVYAILNDDSNSLTSQAVPTGYTQRTGPIGTASTGLDAFSKDKSPAGAEAPSVNDVAASPRWSAVIVALRPAVVAATGGAASPTFQRLNPRWGRQGKSARFHHLQRPYGSLATNQNLSQNLTAGLSFTGSGPKNAISKQVAGGLSFTGSGPKNVITKKLAAILSFTGSGPRNSIGKLLTAALSFTGSSPVRVITKGMTAGLGFVGARTSAVSSHLTGVLAFTGALKGATSKALAGSLSFIGALAGLHFFNKALTATLSFTGSGPVRAIGKTMAAVLGFTGAQARAIAKGMTGGLSFTGTLTRATSYHLVAAGLSFVGNLVSGKFLHSALTGGLSFNGALASVHAYTRGLAAALSFTGSGPLRSVGKAMTAGLSFIGTQARATATHLFASLGFTGALSRANSKRLAAGLSFAGFLNGFNPNSVPKILVPLLMQGASVILNLLGVTATVVSVQGGSAILKMQGPNGKLTIVGGKTDIQEGT